MFSYLLLNIDAFPFPCQEWCHSASLCHWNLSHLCMFVHPCSQSLVHNIDDPYIYKHNKREDILCIECTLNILYIDQVWSLSHTPSCPVPRLVVFGKTNLETFSWWVRFSAIYCIHAGLHLLGKQKNSGIFYICNKMKNEWQHLRGGPALQNKLHP